MNNRKVDYMDLQDLAAKYSYVITYNNEDGTFYAQVEEIPSIRVFSHVNAGDAMAIATDMVVYYLEELAYAGEALPTPLY